MKAEFGQTYRIGYCSSKASFPKSVTKYVTKLMTNLGRTRLGTDTVLIILFKISLHLSIC